MFDIFHRSMIKAPSLAHCHFTIFTNLTNYYIMAPLCARYVVLPHSPMFFDVVKSCGHLWSVSAQPRRICLTSALTHQIRSPWTWVNTGSTLKNPLAKAFQQKRYEIWVAPTTLAVYVCIMCVAKLWTQYSSCHDKTPHVFLKYSSGCEQFAPCRVVKLLCDVVTSEQRISGAGPPPTLLLLLKRCNFLEVCNIFVMFC